MNVSTCVWQKGDVKRDIQYHSGTEGEWGDFPFIPKLFRAEAAFPAPLRGLQWASHDTKPTRNSRNVFPVVSGYHTHALSSDHKRTYITLCTVYCTFVVCTELVLLAFLLSPHVLFENHILNHRVRQQLGRMPKRAFGFKPDILFKPILIGKKTHAEKLKLVHTFTPKPHKESCHRSLWANK